LRGRHRCWCATTSPSEGLKSRDSLPSDRPCGLFAPVSDTPRDRVALGSRPASKPAGHVHDHAAQLVRLTDLPLRATRSTGTHPPDPSHRLPAELELTPLFPPDRSRDPSRTRGRNSRGSDETPCLPQRGKRLGPDSSTSDTDLMEGHVGIEKRTSTFHLHVPEAVRRARVRGQVRARIVSGRFIQVAPHRECRQSPFE
jgi:hypothetical protein